MSTAEIYKNVHRAYITPRIGDDLSKLNRKALEYFHVFLANHPAMSQVLRVSPHHIQRVIENDATYTLLTTVPFAVLSPAFTRLEDWKSLANTKTTTATIDSLRAMMPASLAANTSIHLQNLNERYLDVIRAIGQDSVLAEPFLAIDREITAFLCGLSYSQQHALLENTRTLPLFRWRYDSPVFLQELQNGLLTRDSLIHYIMMSGTVPLRMLPRGNRWGDQRYPLGTKEQYGNALMAHGFRASHAKELLSLHAGRTRDMFKRMHGRSSTCGNVSTSLSWVCADSLHRLHTTFFLYLYRSALAIESDGPKAFIAALNAYERTVPDEQRLKNLHTDRLYQLVHRMSYESLMHVGPCNKCSTSYIMSNMAPKIEILSDFQCPMCSGKLFVSRSRSTKPRKKSRQVNMDPILDTGVPPV
jgi:DNA-directed RNA polymerase subunit RPC12/RpoP